MLSKKLQYHGIDCILKSRYNWFNNSKNSDKWTGRFVCRDHNCKRVYSAKVKIIEENSPVEIKIEWSGTCNHGKLQIKHRYCGEERQKIGELISMHGIEPVMEENEINKLTNDKGQLRENLTKYKN